jgi:hypothetical protein
MKPDDLSELCEECAHYFHKKENEPDPDCELCNEEA